MSFLARHRERPVVIAHRGASGDAPENSLDAFRLAVEQGADGAETDVRVSKDGVVVVHHDPELGRTARGRGAVSDYTAAELALVGIPELAEVLNAVAPLTLCVEIKGGDDIVRRLRPVVADHPVVFFSFDPDHIRELAAEIPDVPTLLLKNPPYDHLFAHGASAVGLDHRAVDRSVVDTAHMLGLAVFVWTVNEPEDVQRAIGLHVDGIITDWPARVRGLLGG